MLTQLVKKWGAYVTATCNVRSVPVIKALGNFQFFMHSGLAIVVLSHKISQLMRVLAVQNNTKKFVHFMLSTDAMLTVNHLEDRGKLIAASDAASSHHTFCIFCLWFCHIPD